MGSDLNLASGDKYRSCKIICLLQRISVKSTLESLTILRRWRKKLL
jgi:hypothetical protein